MLRRIYCASVTESMSIQGFMITSRQKKKNLPLRHWIFSPYSQSKFDYKGLSFINGETIQCASDPGCVPTSHTVILGKDPNYSD